MRKLNCGILAKKYLTDASIRQKISNFTATNNSKADGEER